MRIAPSTRDDLIERAKANGRSVTQEADRLLQQAMHTGSQLDQEFDEIYRDPHLVGLLLTMCENMRDTLTANKADDDWINNPNIFAEVETAAQQTIAAYRPVGEPVPDNSGQMAVAIVRSMLHKITSGGASGIAAVVRNRISVDILRRLQARQRFYGKNGRLVPAPEEINQ